MKGDKKSKVLEKEEQCGEKINKAAMDEGKKNAEKNVKKKFGTTRKIRVQNEKYFLSGKKKDENGLRSRLGRKMKLYWSSLEV